MFVRNFFIYTPLFFGEKYVIEYLTKKEWHSRVCKDKKCKDFIHSDVIFAFRKVSISLGI